MSNLPLFFGFLFPAPILWLAVKLRGPAAVTLSGCAAAAAPAEGARGRRYGPGEGRTPLGLRVSPGEGQTPLEFGV